MRAGFAIAGFFLATVAVPACLAQDARVVALSGTVSVKRAREPVRALAANDLILNGDEIATGNNSEATIRAADGSSVHIFPDSRVVFQERSPDFEEFLHLFLGSIKVHIEKLSGRPNPHKLTTPTAVIAVRGTTFSVFVDDEDATLVAVDEGIVGVAARGMPAAEVELTRGQRCWVRRGQPPSRAQAFRGRSERADLIPMRPQRKEMRVEPRAGAPLEIRLPRRARQMPQE
jgi:hypothetical protein